MKAVVNITRKGKLLAVREYEVDDRSDAEQRLKTANETYEKSWLTKDFKAELVSVE